ARRALRRSFGAGGTVPDIPWRQQQRSDVLAVVLVDVSQSVLDTIDRGFLLRFLRELYDAWRDVRIFFFDTHVREVTDAFAVPSTQGALLALERAEAEWGGGTRIGHAFETVRTEHPYAIDRESTVFVISDGLEVDEIERLEAEMAQVHRKSNAVFWLNPLATSTEYEPTCRGMAASLPYIDGLFPFSDAADVEEMARQLRLRGLGGSIGYQYDRRDRAASASRE
ncbi:MAG: VWA domain-containing protein, partial [Halobacteriales archaeon]